MTLKLILVNEQTGAFADASGFADLFALAEKVESSGMPSAVDILVRSFNGSTTLGLAPIPGMTVIFGDDTAGPGGGWLYLFTGRISALPITDRVDGLGYTWRCVDFTPELNMPVPKIVFNGVDHPTDQARVQALFAATPMGAVWDATSLVGGPFLSYHAQDITPDRGKIGDILTRIATDPGGAVAVSTTLGTPVPGAGAVTCTPADMTGIYVGRVLTIDTGGSQETVTVTAITALTFTATFTLVHGTGASVTAVAIVGTVPARRTSVTAAWTNPANFAAGVTRFVNYYGATGLPFDPIPLTDAADLQADYAADAFTVGSSTTTLGPADTGQVWNALVGTWGRNPGAYTPVATNDSVAVINSVISDGTVTATLAVLADDAGLAFRVAADGGGNLWKGWIWIAQAASTRYGLYKRTGGVYGLITTLAVTPANGDQLQVALSGNTITASVLRGGTSVGSVSVTDSFQAGGLWHGLVNVHGTFAARWTNYHLSGTGVYYLHGWTDTEDAAAQANIVMIEGPKIGPEAAGWDTVLQPPTNVVTATGLVQKFALTDAWDAGASTTQLLGDEGGEVIFSTEKRLLISDTFTRVDSATTLGATETGQGWTTFNSGFVWGVHGLQAYLGTVGTLGRAIAVADAQATSCVVEVTLSTLVLNASRLVFRATDDNNHWFVMPVAGSPNHYELWKCVGGSLGSVLASGGPVPANGDVLKVTLEGSLIQIYVNGVFAFSYTDTSGFNATATSHGIGTTNSGAPARWDTFSVHQLYIGLTAGLRTGLSGGDGLAGDTFTRAPSTSTLGTADSGQVWSVLGSGFVFGITSLQQAYCVTYGGADGLALIDSGQTNVQVEAVLSALDLTFQRVVARASDVNNYLYVQPESGHYTLYQKRSGTPTSLGTVAQTPVVGDVVTLSCRGTTLQVYVNGIGPLITATSTLNPTTTKHGIGAAHGGGTARWDNFVIRGTRLDPDFGIVFGTTRQAEVWEGGVGIGSTLRTYADGDFWRIAVTFSSTQTFYQVDYYYRPAGVPDWVHWYTSLTRPNMQLNKYQTDVAIFSAGGALSNISIEKYAANVFTDPVSFPTYGPRPAAQIITDASLDTFLKRANAAQTYFAQNAGIRKTYDLITSTAKIAGMQVLFNCTRLGITNALKAIIAVQVDRSTHNRTKWLYKVQLDSPPRLYGILDPRRFASGSPDGVTTPPLPSGLAQSGPGVPDSQDAVSIVPIVWSQPGTDCQWIELWAQHIGAQQDVYLRLPAGARFGTLNLAFLAAYHLRARFIPYSGPAGGWCAAITVVGGPRALPSAPTLGAPPYQAGYAPGILQWVQIPFTPPPSSPPHDSYQLRVVTAGQEDRILAFAGSGIQTFTVLHLFPTAAYTYYPASVLDGVVGQEGTPQTFTIAGNPVPMDSGASRPGGGIAGWTPDPGITRDATVAYKTTAAWLFSLESGVTDGGVAVTDGGVAVTDGALLRNVAAAAPAAAGDVLTWQLAYLRSGLATTTITLAIDWYDGLLGAGTRLSTSTTTLAAPTTSWQTTEAQLLSQFTAPANTQSYVARVSVTASATASVWVASYGLARAQVAANFAPGSVGLPALRLQTDGSNVLTILDIAGIHALGQIWANYNGGGGADFLTIAAVRQLGDSVVLQLQALNGVGVYAGENGTSANGGDVRLNADTGRAIRFDFFGADRATLIDGVGWNFGTAESHAYRSISTARTLDATDHAVDCDTTTASFAVTLPAASTGTLVYIITKIDASVHKVTVTAAGGETINGGAATALSTQYASVTVRSNGSNGWVIIASH